MTADGSVRDEIAAALGEHRPWCHAEAHGECCRGECDCGVADSLERLLPVVERLQRQAAARALREAADELDDAMVGEGIRRRLIAPSVGVVADRLRDRADGIEATS